MMARKRKCAEEVAEQLGEKGLLSDETTLVLHAGEDYYGELLRLIEDRDVSVETPTEDLYIGERKAWHKEGL
jgi:hypothetical protein